MAGDLRSTTPRRHDLDALRGFAMLLGIFLHACLAYFPFPWVVQDVEATESIGWFFWSVHGFRMQLFFVLSGFFLAWSISTRRLTGAVSQRLKRIALPLLVGTVTIIPLVDVSVEWALNAVNQEGQSSQRDDIWALAKSGDFDGIEASIEEAGRSGKAAVDQLVNGRDSMGIAPLHWASFHGHLEAIELLLDAGANIDARDGDQSTPLIWAAFFGQPTAVRLLIDREADLEIKNASGETAAAAVARPWSDEVAGVTAWIAGALGEDVDLNRIARSRAEVRRLLGVSLGEGEEDSIATWGGDPWEFHHLWFLWFLCIITTVSVGLCALAQGLGRLTGIRIVHVWKRVCANPVCLVIVVGLTVLAQLPMHNWGSDPMFGPDTSTGLVPPIAGLAYYGVFFLFGVIAYQWRGLDFSIPIYWIAAIPVALFIFLPLGLYVVFERAEAARDFGEESLRPLSVAIQSLYPWLMIFGFFGLFRLCMSGKSRVARYLSDASYWMYLIHLPIVIALQGAFHSLPWGPWTQFLVVSAIGFAASLMSYALFIRRTPLGWILHGRRPSWTRINS